SLLRYADDLAVEPRNLAQMGKGYPEMRQNETFENFRSIDDKATLYLRLWNSPGTIFIFLISKRSALLDLLESFLTTKSPEGLRASQLAVGIASLASSTELEALMGKTRALDIVLGSEITELGGWLSYRENLKRLDDDLQLSRQISIESLHNDLAETPSKA
ncbi:hypothetical protein MTR67_052188, partial [Solanum verrucosum]